MEQVMELLLKQYPDARIFLFGRGAQEDEWFGKWCQNYPACVFVTQQLKTLKKELILMSHLDVMISMDSANMHLASLTGIPVVSIWGATHPYAGFMGWKQSQDNAIRRFPWTAVYVASLARNPVSSWRLCLYDSRSVRKLSLRNQQYIKN